MFHSTSYRDVDFLVNIFAFKKHNRLNMFDYENQMTDFDDLTEDNETAILGANVLLDFVFRVIWTQVEIVIDFIRILPKLISLFVSVCCITLYAVRSMVWTGNCRRKLTIWQNVVLLLQIVIIYKLVVYSFYHMNSPLTRSIVTSLRYLLRF